MNNLMNDNHNTNNVYNEAQMPQNNKPEQPNKNRLGVMLDNESLKILRNVEPVHMESIINIGVKMVAKTNLYKEFLSIAKHEDVVTEDIETLVDLVATSEDGVTQTNTKSNKNTQQDAPKETSKKINAFAAW